MKHLKTGLLTALTVVALFLTSCEKEAKDTTKEVIQKSQLEVEPLLNSDDPENQCKVVAVRGVDGTEASTRSGNTVPIFFIASLSTSNQNVSNQPSIQVAFNKSKVDSVRMDRIGTEEYSIQYTTTNGFWYTQPIIWMTKYAVRLKVQGVWEADSTIYVSAIVGNTFQYKPTGTNLVYENTNTNVFTKVTRLNIRQPYYDWFFGTNRARWFYDINRDGTITQEYLNCPIAVGSAFLFNHVM